MYQYNLGIRFEHTVAAYPDNAALKFAGDHTVSYTELNCRANQLARHLLDIGVSQRDVVCISGIKKPETFACMIACLKIGAPYVMLDPQSPAERQRKIITTCLPKALFVEPALAQQLQATIAQLDIAVIPSEPAPLADRIDRYDELNLQETRSVTGTNPAYIMYTSGSTGFPKGAVMTHDNVLNLIDWSIETYGISPDEVLTNVNPLYFDNSVFDFYSSLFSGACLVPFSKETVTDPQALVTLIDELGCTSWFSVPTLLIFLQTMKALRRDNMKFIRRFIFGGEGYPKAKLKELYDLYSDRAEFYNVYGPTECTCICSSYQISAEDFEDLQGFPPLGHMAKNFSYLILDEHDKLVPDNEVGELCLLGPNVGQGYYNDPERTQIAFVQNPYNDKYTEIMYRTGDLVRYNPEDGKIYIMGRKDHQVKHMGYRIELEEIETALSCLDYVAHAAVVHGTSRGLSRIVAVVSLTTEVDETQVRSDLKDIIPDYMIPTSFHFVSELPRNPNGKVDRRRIAEAYLPQD